MSRIRNSLVLGAGFAICAGSAFAQAPIGNAAVVQNIVQGHTGGPIKLINRGEEVVLNEFIQTASDSKAKFVFLDLTNMSVGPDSEVKLDEFVYSGNGKAQTVSINATKGAFRFFSGNSAHEAYKVTTPQAVIGVRGTTYDVLIGNGQTYVKLQEGAITACVRVGANCRDLDQAGQYLIINDNSIEGPFNSNGSNFDFGSHCAGGAASLCNKQFAVNTPPPPPGGGGFQPPPPANPVPRNINAPLPPGPQLPPPVRAAGLPPVNGGIVAPVYVPPGRPGGRRPPVVVVDPPVYVPPGRPGRPQGRPPVVILDPPVRVPPVYNPPPRPHRPHFPGRPPRPPQEGKPYPGNNPPILREGRVRGYPGRWGNSRPVIEGRRADLPRNEMRPRIYGQGRMLPPRMYSGQQMSRGPRFSSPPRFSSGPRIEGGSRSFGRGGFGGGWLR